MHLQHEKGIADALKGLRPFISAPYREALDDSISIFCSNRRKVFASCVQQLDKRWKVQVVSGIAATAMREMRQLTLTVANQAPVSAAAWSARNLLEVNIWSRWAAQNDNNLEKMRVDAARDMKDFLERLEKISTSGLEDAHPPSPIGGALKALKESAAEQGIASLDDKYTEVRNAATQVDLGDLFAHFNKLLSKLCHPTAMMMVGEHTEATNNVFRRFTLELGCAFFSGAYAELERIVEPN